LSSSGQAPLAATPIQAATHRYGWMEFLTHPLVLVGIVYFVANGLRFLSIHHSEWDEVYILAGQRLAAGQEMYHATKQMPHVFSYPPFMALMALPFTLMPAHVARGVWFLVNVAAVVLLCRWAWIVSGGPRLIGARWEGRQYLILLLGGLCAARFIQDGLDHQQTDLVIGALLLGGCVGILRERFFLAATAIGVAAAMKCTPLLFVGYFLWRRKWLAAGWVVLVAVGCNLLPDLMSRPPTGGLWVGVWFHNLVRPMGEAGYRPGDWYTSVIFNQSLSGAAYRFCETTWSVIRGNLVVVDRAGGMGAGMLKKITYGVEGIVLLGGLWAFVRGRGLRTSLECSVVLLLMLLISPVSSKPHFCTMLLPGLVLGRVAIEKRDWVILGIVLAAILIGNVMEPNFVGRVGGDLGLWLGTVCWSAMLLLIGCYVTLGRPPETKAAL
jgi:alpha-1,2-mannosyltransferase